MLEQLDPLSRAAPPSARKPSPRARGYPVVGLLPALVRDAPSVLRQLARQHPGELIELDLGLTRAYLVTHPEQAQYVLNDNWRNFTKEGGMWKPIGRLLGNGLVTAGGDEWPGTAGACSRSSRRGSSRAWSISCSMSPRAIFRGSRSGLAPAPSSTWTRR